MHFNLAMEKHSLTVICSAYACRPPGDLLFHRQYTNEGVSHFIIQLRRFLADANRTDSPPVVAVSVQQL